VMIGSLFAGTEESPGETILYQGRTFKSYRGMGSTGAMEAGSDRYATVQDTGERGKSVPEGVEGRVPYKGPLGALTDQLVGGLRSGMGYVGASTMKEFKEKSRFIRVTAAGLRERHVHDVIITKEAPNYRMEQSCSGMSSAKRFLGLCSGAACFALSRGVLHFAAKLEAEKPRN